MTGFHQRQAVSTLTVPAAWGLAPRSLVQPGSLNAPPGHGNMNYTELQLKSLEKILIARRARSSYETCFVISFLINHKTGSAIRRCLPD